MIVAPSRELQLLLQCARPRLEAAHLARLRALTAGTIDWDDVGRRAAWHRMLPLMHWHLDATCRGAVPTELRGALAHHFQMNAHRMLRLSAELTGILRALRAAGIRALPYKGPMLAARLYNNLALRASGDLDILVRRSDVLRTRALLIARGYRPRHHIEEHRVPFMLAHRYSETMLRPDVAQVELHWAFTNPDVPFALDLDALMTRAGRGRLGDTDLPSLADEDLALVLCAHGAKHRWNRLEWIAGLATLLRATPDLDYDALLARARVLRSYRRVLLGLLVAHEVLDAPTPHEIVALARADPTLSSLAAEVWRSLELVHLRSPLIERSASLPFDWFHLRLSDSFRDKLRLIGYRLTTPSQPESWNTITWRKHSLPLHAVVRPLQLALRIGPATWSFIQERSARYDRLPNDGTLGGADGAGLSKKHIRLRRPPRSRQRDDDAPLRILQLVQKPQRRGAEIFAQQLNDEFTRLGHVTTTVYLYDCDGPSSDHLTPRAGDVMLSMSEDHITEVAPGVNPQLLRSLKRQLMQFQPDIVQLNGARTVKYGAVLRLLWPTQSWRTVYRNIGDPRDWVPRGPKRLILRQLMREIDGTIGISHESLASLRALYHAADPAVVIPNGILPDAVRARRPRDLVRAEFGANARTPVVLFVGSLTIEKRVDLLLDAFADVVSHSPNAVLWIVGGGPLRSELESRTKVLGLAAAVRFLGLRSDVGTILAAADMLALSSDTEGMPAVALEAGYHGLPVISTRVGSIADCVLSGETGLLVDRGSVRQLAAAMFALVHDVDRRTRMGERARAWISENFTIDRIADQYLRFYRAVLPAGISSQRMPNGVLYSTQ